MTTDSGIRTFEGAVALVTGAASGIGEALAQELAHRGCEVVLGDVDVDLAEQVAASIRERGGKASAVELDVTDAATVARVVRQTATRCGRLDYMFNNAGIGTAGELCQHTVEAWRRIVDVNLMGVVHGVQAAYPIMIAQGFGHIVNTASMAGLTPLTVSASYTATKHAVVGLSKVLRAEAHATGVRASVLCPGVIRTPLLAGGRHGIFLENRISERGQRELAVRMLERLRPMDVARFARKALDAVAADKAIIIVPAWWKIFWWLERLSPTLFGLNFARKAAEATRRELDTVRNAEA